MLYKEVNFDNFCDEFEKFNRDDNFSYTGKETLFEYLQNIETITKLDIIGICCDYSETTIDEAIKYYDIEVENEEEKEEKVKEFFEDKGVLIASYNDMVLIQNF